jgi:hypothetical protein
MCVCVRIKIRGGNELGDSCTYQMHVLLTASASLLYHRISISTVSVVHTHIHYVLMRKGREQSNRFQNTKLSQQNRNKCIGTITNEKDNFSRGAAFAKCPVNIRHGIILIVCLVILIILVDVDNKQIVSVRFEKSANQMKWVFFEIPFLKLLTCQVRDCAPHSSFRNMTKYKSCSLDTRSHVLSCLLNEPLHLKG